MFLFLVFLFTIIPAVEIYLLFSIGGAIGGVNTFFIVITTGILGAALAKTQGLAIFGRIQESLQKGQVPAQEFTNGLLVFGGGLLLLTPGFLTDILGFSMVMPGTRYIISLFIKGLFEKSIKNGTTTFHTSFGNEESKSREVEPGVFEADFHETKSSENDKDKLGV